MSFNSIQTDPCIVVTPPPFGHRKTPGGVFLTLVRKNTSAEECKQIFHDDKKRIAQRKKEKQLQRIMENEARIRKQEELEAEKKWLEQTRQEKNMEKRLAISVSKLIPRADSDDGQDGVDEPASPEASKDDLMLKCWKESIHTLVKPSARDIGETPSHQDSVLAGCRHTCRAESSSVSHGGDEIDTFSSRHGKYYDGKHLGSVSRQSGAWCDATNASRSSCFVETRSSSTNRTRTNGSKRSISVGGTRAAARCDEVMEVCPEEGESELSDQLTHDEILARQFDLTDETDLDFGIDFG